MENRYVSPSEELHREWAKEHEYFMLTKGLRIKRKIRKVAYVISNSSRLHLVVSIIVTLGIVVWMCIGDNSKKVIQPSTVEIQQPKKNQLDFAELSSRLAFPDCPPFVEGPFIGTKEDLDRIEVTTITKIKEINKIIDIERTTNPYKQGATGNFDYSQRLGTARKIIRNFAIILLIASTKEGIPATPLDPLLPNDFAIGEVSHGIIWGQAGYTRVIAMDRADLRKLMDRFNENPLKEKEIFLQDIYKFPEFPNLQAVEIEKFLDMLKIDMGRAAIPD